MDEFDGPRTNTGMKERSIGTALTTANATHVYKIKALTEPYKKRINPGFFCTLVLVVVLHVLVQRHHSD